MSNVAAWSKVRRLSPELQERIRAYFEKNWDIKKGVDEKQILGLLPTTLHRYFVVYVFVVPPERPSVPKVLD